MCHVTELQGTIIQSLRHRIITDLSIVSTDVKGLIIAQTCLSNKSHYNEVKCFNLFNESGGNYYLSETSEEIVQYAVILDRIGG